MKYETVYTIGEEYEVPFDKVVWDFSRSERNEWARNWLKNNGHKIRANTYIVGKKFSGGTLPNALAIRTHDYKFNIQRYT